jgi:cytochrome c-type biogenesis protein CcmF
MAELGTFSVLLAVAAAAWAVGAAALGTRRETFQRSAEGALRGAFLSLTVASAVLVALFLTRDFSVRYVAEYSDLALPTAYTVAAFWAGQDGSLLLWAWLLAGLAVLAVRRHRARDAALMPTVVVTLAAVLLVITALVAFTSNPFERLGFVPEDGAGLNAMLQNWGQLYHPPATFAGYVGFTVPFAFAVAALVTGHLDDRWIRTVRVWMVVSWLLLTFGILLGARWAYTELGWGGYWAWDPVENASLLPWLTATAYLHSAVIQERRGKLKVWNVSLVIATFVLTIFGTFLVRSGVASSVHAFAESSAGMYLLGVVVAVVIASAVLVTWRLPLLRSHRDPIAPVSREAAFVLTNVLLVGFTLVVFWGTLYPVVMSVLRGTDVTVGAPFFDRMSLPFALLLLGALALCPVLAWRRASARGLGRRVAVPFGVGMAAGGVAAVLDRGSNVVTVLVLSLSAFAVATIVSAFGQALRVHRHERAHGAAVGHLFARNPRRWGGAVVHLGIVLLIVGVTLDATYRSDERITLTVGDAASVGGHVLTFESLDSEMSATRVALRATLGVARQGGGSRGALVTERSLLANQDQPRTSVGVRSLLREDVYVILEEVDVDSQTATFNVFLHPGVLWLWLGGGLLMVGGVLAVWPYRGRAAAVGAAGAAGGAGAESAAAAEGVLVGGSAPDDRPEVP